MVASGLTKLVRGGTRLAWVNHNNNAAPVVGRERRYRNLP